MGVQSGITSTIFLSRIDAVDNTVFCGFDCISLVNYYRTYGSTIAY